MKVELTIRYGDGTDVFVEDWGDCHELLRLLAEAGVLEVDRSGWTADEMRAWFKGTDPPEGSLVRYVSPWKEAK